MNLEQKHEEFVVVCLARFMNLHTIVKAFIEKYEDELPTYEPSRKRSVEELMALPMCEEEIQEQLEFVNKFIKEREVGYQNKYGDETDKILNEKAHQEYEEKMKTLCIELHEEDILAEATAAADFPIELKENLFKQFSRLDIKHPLFPNKYRALFNQTRDEYCANYRIQDLNTPENLTRELETLYGYQKQLIFIVSQPDEVMKHVNSAHQILKTIVAHNTVNAKQEVVDITPQNVKALEDSQKALTDQLKEVTQQLAAHTGTSK